MSSGLGLVSCVQGQGRTVATFRTRSSDRAGGACWKTGELVGSDRAPTNLPHSRDFFIRAMVASMRRAYFRPPLTVAHPPATPIEPPTELGATGLDLWRRIQAEYRIADAAGIELLAQACAAADRAHELSVVIAKDGATIETKYGLREHPCLKSEMANRSFIAKTLQRLALAVEDDPRRGTVR
jgi:hypothetical protein